MATQAPEPQQPPADPPAPVTQAGLEAVADGLSACADALHARLMRAIRANTPGVTTPGGLLTAGISQGAAQALFENEVALRQRANGLYLDAAELAAAGLAVDQQALLEVHQQARAAMAAIERLQDLIALTAELLAVGAAIASGQPQHLLAPYQKLRQHLAQLQQLDGATSDPPLS